MEHFGAILIFRGAIFIAATVITLWRAHIGRFMVTHRSRLKLRKKPLIVIVVGVPLLLALLCGFMLFVYVYKSRNEPLRRLYGVYIWGYAAMLFAWFEIIVKRRWSKRQAKRRTDNQVDTIALGEQTQQLTPKEIYDQNAKVTAIFWEWRHKIMTHFFGAIGAIIAVSGWLYVQHDKQITIWHCFPLLIGGIYSYVSFLLDSRHTKILRKCYSIGAEIERCSQNERAIFTFIKHLHYTAGSLTQILHTVYRTSAFLLLGLSILVFAYATSHVK